jgi:hypothetical protein
MPFVPARVCALPGSLCWVRQSAATASLKPVGRRTVGPRAAAGCRFETWMALAFAQDSSPPARLEPREDRRIAEEPPDVLE